MVYFPLAYSRFVAYSNDAKYLNLIENPANVISKAYSCIRLLFFKIHCLATRSAPLLTICLSRAFAQHTVYFARKTRTTQFQTICKVSY